MCQGSYYVTGKAGVLQSAGSQKVTHNLVTEQQQQNFVSLTLLSLRLKTALLLLLLLLSRFNRV